MSAALWMALLVWVVCAAVTYVLLAILIVAQAVSEFDPEEDGPPSRPDTGPVEAGLSLDEFPSIIARSE